jgi:hypothetical protein
MHTTGGDLSGASRIHRWLLVLGWLGLVAAGCDDPPPADPSCFSPSQNLDSAYQPGSAGCACRSGVDQGVCVPDSTGRRVALVCSNGTWTAVEDGPCGL